MPEIIEKAKLVAGVPFHLADAEGSFHFKRSYLGYIQGFPMVEGSLVDDSKDAWAPNNFIRETRNGMEPGNYRDFDMVVLEVPEVPGLQEAETVYGRVVDQERKPWDPGNFQRIKTAIVTEIIEVNGQEKEKKRIVQSLELRDINSWQFWKLSKIGSDGIPTEVIYGRTKTGGAPWDGNFEVFLTGAAGADSPKGWTELDYNKDFPDQTWKKERVAPKIGRKSALDKTKLFAIRFKENFSYTNWKNETVIDRDFLLSTGATLWKLLEEKIKTTEGFKIDPLKCWMTLTYTEKPRGDGTTDAPPEVTYGIDVVPMTEDELKALPVEVIVAKETKVPATAQEEVAPHPAEEELFSEADDIKLDEIPF